MSEDLDVLREPWQDAAFQADLAALTAGAAESSRRYAADAVLLARLAAQVPRSDWDTRGATPWTSFLAEVAVARSTSTQAAALHVADAVQLVDLMPRTLGLLQEGRLPLQRARALLDAARPCPDDLVRVLDEQLAERAVQLVPARVRAAADRLALQHEVDAAARRAASATRGRRTRFAPLPDGQAEFALVGPALPLAQYASALDADARAWHRALQGTGDGRGLDQLRFDLALHRGLGAHAPVVPAPRAGHDVDDTPGLDPHGATPASCGPVATAATTSDPSSSATAPAATSGSTTPPAATSGSTTPPAATSGSTTAPTATGVAAGPAASGAAAVVAAADAASRGADPSVPPDDPQHSPALPDPSTPGWWTDRRFSRPVQLHIQVPVTTALGLADEPGWLPGYGWVAAPQVRQLLPVAELRQLCMAGADSGAAGLLVDAADRVVRPADRAEAVRDALLGMATAPFDVTDKTWRQEPQHDPSPALAAFVALRDPACDGPTGTWVPSRRADLDHDHPWAEPEPEPEGRSVSHEPPTGRTRRPEPATAVHGDLGLQLDPRTGWLTLTDLAHPALAQPDLAHPDLACPDLDCLDAADSKAAAAGHAVPATASSTTGPTAAWNLVPRGRRAHGLKHRGWTPLRTATSTLWLTPAGQSVEVPHDLVPPTTLERAALPDPEDLHRREAELLTWLDEDRAAADDHQSEAAEADAGAGTPCPAWPDPDF